MVCERGCGRRKKQAALMWSSNPGRQAAKQERNAPGGSTGGLGTGPPRRLPSFPSPFPPPPSAVAAAGGGGGAVMVAAAGGATVAGGCTGALAGLGCGCCWAICVITAIAAAAGVGVGVGAAATAAAAAVKEAGGGGACTGRLSVRSITTPEAATSGPRGVAERCSPVCCSIVWWGLGVKVQANKDGWPVPATASTTQPTHARTHPSSTPSAPTAASPPSAAAAWPPPPRCHR